MVTKKTHLKNSKVVMSEPEKGICLNNQTVGNMRKYLKDFPDDAKITIWHDYKTFDCQICCNFERQKETSTVMLMLGSIFNSDD